MSARKPRRAGARWREGAPTYILDCFDSKGPGERYTVMFAEDNPEGYVEGLGMSDAPSHPQGVSMWFELKVHEAAAYRCRIGKQRVRWLDLPVHIRKHVEGRFKAVY